MKLGDRIGGTTRVAVVVTAAAEVVVVVGSTTGVVEMGDAAVGEAAEGGGEASLCTGSSGLKVGGTAAGLGWGGVR